MSTWRSLDREAAIESEALFGVVDGSEKDRAETVCACGVVHCVDAVAVDDVLTYVTAAANFSMNEVAGSTFGANVAGTRG
ncbi:MAG TPA: hypothetical protein VEJ46_13020 [Candidatus Acidoferrum sp.]|nr:hypothetical protein [Candidatus Acidoferrum sp.]